MIISEPYITEDGRELVRTYSDLSNRIRRNDGVIYDGAIDPPNSGRTYTETDEPISSGEEATEEDKNAALARFGMEVMNE